PGLWEITLNARPGKRAKDLEATLYEELERVAAEGVTGEELERAKNRLELSFLGGMETAAGKAEQIGFYETLTGKPNHAFTRLAELLRVQSKDVARVVRAFDRPNRNVVTVLPKAKRPAKATRARATKRRAAKRGARA
ncbi:MAG: insulinase family protein, partial [Polyangiales bacterium]